MPQKSLKEILQDLPITWQCDTDVSSITVNSIQLDSRRVTSGDVFVAIKGESINGHDFIHAAVKQGAAAVVGTRENPHLKVPYIRVKDAREALAYLAAALHDHPSRKLMVIGVTGTDGKTTTCNLIYQILKTAGKKSGLISTVNAVIGDEVIDTGFHVTTPEATDVQYYLSQMVEAGLTHVVLETTSHGLVQHRVTGVEYDTAVVTNITHEHLDYHGSYEEYRAAKGRMFKMLDAHRVKPGKPGKLAVLNADDHSFEYLDKATNCEKLTYGITAKSDIGAKNILCTPSGVDFQIFGKGMDIPVHFNLPGSFNVSNCLAAIGAAVFGAGISAEDAVRGIAALEGVPGRMENINLGQNFTAIVDFAHTPNALEKAIETAREMTKGRIITVFGSAGLRDRQKRRMMAEVSVKKADITILTAEDPRNESLDAILAMMADAAEGAGGVEGNTFYRVPDRGEAIRLGVKLAKPGDLVIACGKGHEQSMCFITTEYPWDDRTAMRAALAELLKIPGPEMPRLPTSK